MAVSSFSTTSWILILLTFVSSIFGQDFPLPLITSTTCDEACLKTAQLAYSFEQSQHAHSPRDAFYDIPRSFHPSLKPGTVLRVEAHTNLTNYTVPSSLTMSRILYVSETLNGTSVPVSAFVLWPYAPFHYENQKSSATGPKFPMVAWSHGTSGIFPDCAPSNYRSLQYHFMTSYSLALEGFAVVATDYAGLGVTTMPNNEQTHPWLAGPAGAKDVAYAVIAARKAFPAQFEPDGPFVETGHSQGGNVAWAFAERQAEAPLSGYKGTISISPPTRVIKQIEAGTKALASDPSSALRLPWIQLALSIPPRLIASITAVYPAYNYSGWTSQSYDRWKNVIQPLSGCLPTDNLVGSSLPFDEQVKPAWTNNSYVQKWEEHNHVSGRKIKGPLLVIVGDTDVVSVDAVQKAVDDTCRVNGDQDIEFYTYEAMQHFPVIQASRPKWLNWIKERITASEDSYSEQACGKQNFVKGFNTNYTLQTITPNWLVSWVPPQLSWELSL